MNNSPLYIVNVEGAIFKDNEWLLVKRSTKESHAGGTWSLVGGKVENPSTTSAVLEDTLRREINEEVHIEVEDKMDYVTSIFFVADNNDPVVDIIFLCKYKSGDPHITDTNELTETRWVTLEEIKQNDKVMSWTKKYIELAEKRKSSMVSNSL